MHLYCHQCSQDTCITWAGSFWRNKASLMMFVSRPNWISWCAALSAAFNEIWLARASGGPCDAAPEPVTMATNRLRFYIDTTPLSVSFTPVSLPLCRSSSLFVEVFFCQMLNTDTVQMFFLHCTQRRFQLEPRCVLTVQLRCLWMWTLVICFYF